MDVQWSLDTHGDPLGKLHEFISFVWQKSGLYGMLVTLDDGGSHATPRFITDPAAILQINPFRPLMELNAARLIPAILATHPDARIGALLRPCEMRALVEMSKHTPMPLDRLLTISVDCLGTLPADEYQWRRERLEKGHSADDTARSDELAQEAIKFARQGGLVPYRYRTACQVCASPASGQADVNLHVLGLPVHQKMLVSVRALEVAKTLALNGYANGSVDEGLIQQHERILSRMSERHARLIQRLNDSLGGLLPADVDALIHRLEACGDCQACMDACPICSVDRPERDAQGHYARPAVMRWLVSCAGCGMCEQACPKSLPTAAIFAHIRRQLDQQYNYAPGGSLDEQLPLM